MEPHFKERILNTTREIYMMCKAPSRKKGAKVVVQNLDSSLEQSKLMQQDVLVMLNEIEYTLDKTLDRFKSYMSNPETHKVFMDAKKAVGADQREENIRMQKEK